MKDVGHPNSRPAIIGAGGVIIAAIITASIDLLVPTSVVLYSPLHATVDEKPPHRHSLVSYKSCTNLPKPLQVNFIRPRSGAIVPIWTDVIYSINGEIPIGYHGTLLVRDPIGQYWSWGASTTQEHSRVQIGVKKDSGENFSIGVLVTNLDLPMSKPTRNLPAGICYDSISVTRG